ncbi:TRAP transporter substrate-binding protein [Helicobacter turcicus]|uniref:TRAP transporter substrate-binding protein DctP n=1 Tax=Helicobacter turcicus TaxID=2867412 RepID=A0ABS7JNA5_9HELI|nr:TRAP transporter substrate-binding protein DctP [Helicobacter turcicus]MBX7490872.1 TRAP transporter substrate-binding protein DctP [Helicobacter turcicus]MBX7545726.1 TRAP transporter substrate-binding protein DctP [Helicobacter turcicus]
MQRREFLKNTGLGAVSVLGAATLVGCGGENKGVSGATQSAEVTKRASVKIRLAMTWPITLPILADTVKHYAKIVNELSSGSITIEIFPAGKLVPALGVFDAVSSGQIDAYHAAPYYWEGKNTAFNLFSGIPFGMIDSEVNAWYLYGEGMDLWREIAAKYNLYPLLGGATSIQMAGWYKKEMLSIKDFEGLRIRMVGIAGQVLSKLGAATKSTPGGEIVPNLERGVLDAAEWVSPAFDLKLDIHKVAPYYYTPWQEAGSITEFVFNKQKWESYPKEVQTILEVASREAHMQMTAMGQFYNAKAMEDLKAQGAKVRTFSAEILETFKKTLAVVLEEESAKNPDFAKVLASYQSFQQEQKVWTNDSLGAYLNIR